MKHTRSVWIMSIAAAVTAGFLELSAPAGATQTDIAPAPLGTAPTATVLPNLMFILDDSGSMAREFMPDEVQFKGSTFINTCKACSSSACALAGSSGTICVPGHPPYYTPQFNSIYYNPQITYKPGVDSTGASLGNANPNNALDDPYSGSPSGKDAVTTWTDIYWCTTSSPSTAQLSDPAVCRRNGINTTVPFTYGTTNPADFSAGLPTTTFRNAVFRNGNPHYYEISPREFCSDETLVNCVAATAPSTANPVPAPVRWCKSDAFAAQLTEVSGTGGPPAPTTTAKCQAKTDSTYVFPRLGKITRTDIVSSTATYVNRPNRTDCAAKPSCTYAEEVQNFANWYSYYRSRMLMMKTSSGLVFSALDDRYRVGFLTINASSSARYLKIDKFEPTHKNAWFTKFYSMTPSGSTPLRQALSRAGRHYAGRTDGINSFMPDDPIQYSCQQNFALLTTDGYWNSSRGKQIDGTTDIGNQDNVDAGLSTRAAGAFDGIEKGAKETDAGSLGSSNTLADVAMYYYKNDLRTTGTVAKNNVPTSTKDSAAHQHMVTFTLGLGLDGKMSYRADYETAGSGDFFKIKSASTGCPSFSPTSTCNWPLVEGDTPSALDDLWHAAVNGRGTYFSAKDPNAVQISINNALSAIKITTGAAASSATSTPNITPTDNFIFSSTYRTVRWDGEVVAERIDVTTGAVIPGTVWSAQTLLDARVTATTDTRTIYTLDTADPVDKLKPFLYANLSATEKAFFDNKCNPAVLPQCGPMAPAQLALANDGTNMVNFLRGQTGNEVTLYRDREHVLGDTVNAKPAFVAKPNLLYGDAVTPDYSSFKAGPAGSRQSVLYIASNDGMLHAFNADTGNELWAYIPRMIMPELYKLAASNYDINHRFYADGSPSTMDVFIGGAWKTILVGGLNAGGRGFYALDVTDPVNPKGLWEICSDATLCAVFDDNIGLSFGQAVITKRPSDGKWVAIVTSGYNNVLPGDGNGYLFVLDAETGAILSKVGTTVLGIPVGDTTTPSGFAKISGFATNFAVNNTTPIVYGGDLLGNVWKYDMTTVPPTVKRIAQLKDGSAPARPQSITTRPEITRFSAGFNVIYIGTGRLLGSTDLQDPATLIPPENLAYQQTVYAFKDIDADLGDLRLPGAKLVQQTMSLIDANNRTISSNPVDWSTQNGWFVDFNPANDSPGERVNIDMQLVRGVLLVATNEPNSEPCSTGGNSFFYQFDYQSGSYVASAPGAIVGTKLSSALAAGFVVYRLPSGQLKFAEINVNGVKKVGGVNPGSGGAIGKRVSWRELF
jgi:type IV pilus assembly protein PilY1